MRPSLDLSGVAALVADPSRAAMLDSLFDGSSKSIGELASLGDISLSTASEHVTRLAQGGLVESVKVGRRRMVRLRDAHVAAVLEQLAGLAQVSERDAGTTKMALLRAARTCYDHLAGRLGVAVTDGLAEAGILIPRDGAFDVSDSGVRWFAGLGIAVGDLSRHRAFARACLDWTERRPHLSGSLGAALAERLLERRWIVRLAGTRALLITPEGREGLRREIGDQPAWGAPRDSDPDQGCAAVVCAWQRMPSRLGSGV